jgi:hypothetical protein
LGIDDLRAATPLGSISALTRDQASELIDRLSGGRPQGTATAKQLGMIAHLRDLIGFTDAEFSAWLSKRFKVDSLAQITDRAHASRVIGGLVRMHANRSGGGETAADGYTAQGGHRQVRGADKSGSNAVGGTVERALNRLFSRKPTENGAR